MFQIFIGNLEISSTNTNVNYQYKQMPNGKSLEYLHASSYLFIHLSCLMYTHVRIWKHLKNIRLLLDSEYRGHECTYWFISFKNIPGLISQRVRTHLILSKDQDPKTNPQTKFAVDMQSPSQVINPTSICCHSDLAMLQRGSIMKGFREESNNQFTHQVLCWHLSPH